MQRDAKVVAWECLKQTYRPGWIKKVDAIAVLETIEDEMPAKDRLHYLEKRLQFLQTPEPGDSTRIILDPLAEYLAAAYLVEQTCKESRPPTLPGSSSLPILIKSWRKKTKLQKLFAGFCWRYGIAV